MVPRKKGVSQLDNFPIPQTENDDPETTEFSNQMAKLLILYRSARDF